MADLQTKTRAKGKLSAVAPEAVEPRKPKVLIFGPPGVGKTWTAIDFPMVYYFDHEGGADLDHYRAKLKTAGGAYFGPEQGSLDFEAVIAEVQTLATIDHPYKTMVFDSATKLFNASVSEESDKITARGHKDEFGASRKPVVRQMARLVNWVNRADMNAIFICHQKAMWERNAKTGDREEVGWTFDCWEKLEYELHLILRISKIGDGDNARRYAHIGKSRLLSFPEGTRIDWSYADFAERYGRDVIERTGKTITLATPDQIEEVRRLLDVVKVSEDWQDKVFKKAGVEQWAEMDADKIDASIAWLKERIVP